MKDLAGELITKHMEENPIKNKIFSLKVNSIQK